MKDEINGDNISIVAAGVAFYGLLAVFPALAARVTAKVKVIVAPGATGAERLSGPAVASVARVELAGVTVVVVEPTACLGLAAARYAGLPIKGTRIGVIVTGGNIDLPRYLRLLQEA